MSRALTEFVGKWIFYLGYRIMPLKIRRGVGLILAVGIKWADQNDEIVTRVMNGEHMDIAIGFKTEAE